MLNAFQIQFTVTYSSITLADAVFLFLITKNKGSYVDSGLNTNVAIIYLKFSH